MFDNATSIFINGKEVESIVSNDGLILYSNDSYDANKKTPTLTIQRNKSDCYVNDTFNISGVLQYSDIGLSDKYINVYNGNTLIDTITTIGEYGMFSKSIVPTPQMVGTQTYHVVFDGDDEYNRAISRNVSIDVNEAPRVASITLATDDSDYFVENDIILTATVIDQYNNPISGKTISFDIDSSSIGTGVTNENGIATVNFKTNYVGELEFIAKYNNISSNSVSVSIDEWTPSSIVLSCNKEYVVKNNPVILTATVKDGKNHGMNNQTVSFKVNNTKVGESTTNSNGVATYTYTPSSSGTITLSADVSEISSNNVSLRVKNNNNTYNVNAVASPNPALVGEDIFTIITVTDADGDPVPNRKVLTSGVELGTTDSDGVFELPSMGFNNVGDYNLTLTVDNKSVTLVFNVISS